MGEAPTQTIDWDAVKVEFAELVAEAPATDDESESPALDFDAIVRGDGPESSSLEKGRSYAERLGATLAESSQGHGFVNGKHLDMNDVRFVLCL